MPAIASDDREMTSDAGLVRFGLYSTSRVLDSSLDVRLVKILHIIF